MVLPESIAYFEFRISELSIISGYTACGSVANTAQNRDALVSTYLHPKQLKAETAPGQICP